MKITVRLYRGKRVIRRLVADRSKWSRLHRKLASAVSVDRFYVRVEYGKYLSNLGIMENFINEYDGNDREEAKQALSAFIEKSI